MEWRLNGPGATDLVEYYEHYPYIAPDYQAGFWPRIHMTADMIRGARQPSEAVCELGCNAGHLLELIGPPCWGYDIGNGPLAVARAAGRDARRADITTADLALAEIVVLSEVLEHLDDPHGMLARLNRDPVRVVIASSPYLETGDRAYEQHCFAWDLDGYSALLEGAGFTVTQRATVGIFQAQMATR